MIINNIKKKYFVEIISVIFITFFWGWTGLICAQGTLLMSADKFFKHGNYEDAITEYKRFIFFNTDSELVSNAYEKIGLAYREQKKWAESVEAFRNSLAITSSDSLRDEKKISIAVIMIARGNYSAAEIDLLRISHFSKYTVLKRKALFLLGVCQLYSFKWEKSRNTLGDYYAGTSENDIIEVDSLFAITTNIQYKLPYKAKWFSTFIPGSGQMYCGDFRNGFNAMILNSITSYLFFNSLFDRHFQDAFVGFLTPFERYYRGNRYHAERIAHAYNKKLNSTIAQKILTKLQQAESVPNKK